MVMDKDFIDTVINKEAVSCTMGGDPEFFVAEKSTGIILNSDRFFPPKTDPLIINSDLDGRPNKLYFDGIQAEMGFSHSQCRENIIDNIKKIVYKVKDIIGEPHKMVMSPAVKVKKDIIRKAHPEARIFGCMPDWNAYTLTTNTPEMDASRHPYRYAGGHIHLGWSSPYLKEGNAEYELVKRPENHIRTIRFLDLMVSLITLSLDNADGSKQRRDKYGKAGCFRPTPYGIEYRTPSCWWLRSPATTSLVMGLGRLAWSLLTWNLDGRFRDIVGAADEDVRGIVNEGDTKSAYEIWKRMRPYLALMGTRSNPLNLNNCIVQDDAKFDPWLKSFKLRSDPEKSVSAIAAFEYIVRNGVDSFVNPDPFTAWDNSGGFSSNVYYKFIQNNDFKKFQTEFLTKELPEEI